MNHRLAVIMSVLYLQEHSLPDTHEKQYLFI